MAEVKSLSAPPEVGLCCHPLFWFHFLRKLLLGELSTNAVACKEVRDLDMALDKPVCESRSSLGQCP